MKSKKNKSFILLAVILFMVFSSCVNNLMDSGQGTISINLGVSSSSFSIIDDSRTSLWPPQDHDLLDKLHYKIILTGNGQIIDFPAKGGEQIRRNVDVGRWRVDIEAYYLNELYATGFNYADVRAGQFTTVRINMKPAGHICDDCGEENCICVIPGDTCPDCGYNESDCVCDTECEGCGYWVTIEATFISVGRKTKHCELYLVHRQNIILPQLEIKSESEWNIARDLIFQENGGKEYTLIIGNNFEVEGFLEPTFGEEIDDEYIYTEYIHVTIIGNNHILTLTNEGNILNIGKNQTVVIENLALEGDSNSTSLVYVEFGTFIMRGNASIFGNKNDESFGGGVYVEEGTFIMEDESSICNNEAEWGGGGVSVDGGTFIMDGNSKIYDNKTYGNGGGVSVDGGTFTMKGNSKIYGNEGWNGGGVSVDEEGIFIMKDNSSIHDNEVETVGGGVYVDGGSFTMEDNSSVHNNEADYGGGVYVDEGIFIMKNNSSIHSNETSLEGGGVYITEGTFTMEGNSKIYDNESHDIGGGVSVVNSTFIMRGSPEIYNNTAEYGGGIALNGSELYMEGGTVYGNDGGDKRNTAEEVGASLLLIYGSTAKYGPSASGTGENINITTSITVHGSTGIYTNDTIKVVNGVLVSP